MRDPTRSLSLVWGWLRVCGDEIYGVFCAAQEPQLDLEVFLLWDCRDFGVVPLSTGSVARAMCVEIRVFWVCGYLFLSNFNLSPELAVPAELQVLPPGTNHSHSSTSAHFCCLLPGGENPLLVGLKSRGENCRQENIPGLSRAQSLGNSAWAQS